MAEIGDAVFDTESDRFVTGVWPDRQLDRILMLWKRNHPDLNMSRFEKRLREYNLRPEERQAILVVDKTSNRVVCYYHWGSRGYARAYEPERYFFVRYTPSGELDITDVMDRNGMTLWNGRGDILTDWNGECGCKHG